MNKLWLLLIFFSFSLHAEDKAWDYQHRYKLKKDQIANITIGTTESKGEEKIQFYFRWTLIVKDRVTTLVNSEGYPHQYVLYKKRSLDRVLFPLLRKASDELNNKTYLLLVLSDVNQSKNEVNFDIFIKDNKKRILVDFNQPEDK
jgi:hypothetical protein